MAKLWLIDGPNIQELKLPEKQEGTVILREECGVRRCNAKPCYVFGQDCHVASDDRAYVATAITQCCKQVVGVLRYEPDTIFGIHEDEAVLVHGRARVY